MFRPLTRALLALALLGPAGCASRAKHSVALYESGDYAASMRAADEGLASHPDDSDLWGMKVRAALALGDADAVAKAYAGYLEHNHGDDDKQLLRDLAGATIAQALASPSVRLQIAAIEAVASLEINDLADAVAAKMQSDNDRVAAAAAAAELRGMPQAPQLADELTHSDDPEARRIVIDAIGKKVGKLALGDLEKAASDKNAGVRRTAIRWLGHYKDKDAIEILVKRMHDPDGSVRAATATALAHIGIGNLAAYAKQALADHDVAVRTAGVDLLAAAHADADLVALVDDKDPMVGLQAAIAIKSSHPDLATKAVARAAAAEEWTARAGAANYLVAALGKSAALDAARKLAGDSELGVRLAAARTLLHAGAKDDAHRIFTAALTDPAPAAPTAPAAPAAGAPDPTRDTRASAAMHEMQVMQAAADLASMGDAAGIDALTKYLRDPSHSEEQRAAAATAHLSAHRVTPGLVAALADPSAVVRIEAAAVLGELSKEKDGHGFSTHIGG